MDYSVKNPQLLYLQAADLYKLEEENHEAATYLEDVSYGGHASGKDTRCPCSFCTVTAEDKEWYQ